MRIPLLLCAAAMVITVACKRGPLRGDVTPSPDGKTYLAIEDAGACDLFVDGKKWPQPQGVPGPISPGSHEVECLDRGEAPGGGAGIGFEVKAGETFRFNYWGP